MENDQIVMYQTADGSVILDVKPEYESLWLSLNQLSALFNKDKSVILKHLRNVYRDNELDKIATVAKKAIVQNEGQREVIRNIAFYSYGKRLII